MKTLDHLLKDDQGRLRAFKALGYDIPRARDFILSKAGLLKGKVLEIGTGKGHLAVALAKKGAILVSVDLDKNAQKVAKARLQALHLQHTVKMTAMDAENLKFKDASFDTAICGNFLHHARRPYRCVKEMMRVACRKIIIADLNKRGERVMNRVHAGEGRSHPQTKASFKAIKALLESRGFNVKSYNKSCETVLVAQKL